MKRLLRGVIDFGDGRLSQDALANNFHRLYEAQQKLKWIRPEDERLFLFIKAFFEHNLALPASTIVTSYFDKLDDIEVTERIKEVEVSAIPYNYQNYQWVIRELLLTQGTTDMAILLKETTEINVKGLKVGKGKDQKTLQGPEQAVAHFLERAWAILPDGPKKREAGTANRNPEEAWQRYVDAEATKGPGALTGFETIDRACEGLRPGQLWIHAAFAGEMKTSIALNVAYNLVTQFRRNVLYISLEMPYEEIRSLLCVMHSAHGKYRAEGKEPLDYRKVEDGKLSWDEKVHYQKVLKDFDLDPHHGGYCRLFVWSPGRDVSLQEIRTEVQRRHKDFEVGFLVIDHSGNLKLPPGRDDYGIKLNQTMREAKMLALGFDGGAGVPVLLLHQTNREGKKSAEKQGGRYGLYHLSYANEAERSADIVTASFLDDELREDGRVVVTCLKNRNRPHFPPVRLSVDWRCRRVWEDAHPHDAPDIGLDDLSDVFNRS